MVGLGGLCRSYCYSSVSFRVWLAQVCPGRTKLAVSFTEHVNLTAFGTVRVC